MTVSRLQGLRAGALRHRFALALTILVWFGSTLLFLGHNPHHSIEPDDHCALCISHISADPALPARIDIEAFSSFHLFSQNTAPQNALNAYLIAPGIRDPPVSV